MTAQTPRVLLATSGSEASRQATGVAADLASTFDAQVEILLIGRARRTRRWLHAHAPCPVLPVKTDRPATSRTAGEPVVRSVERGARLAGEGLELADRCDGITLAERARAKLVAAGARPRRRALSGPQSLTPAELRTARLAAPALSNREIAQALFVATKTVSGSSRTPTRSSGSPVAVRCEPRGAGGSRPARRLSVQSLGWGHQKTGVDPDENSAAARDAAPMSGSRPVQAMLELRHGASTIAGTVRVDGAGPAEFYGWLELIALLDGAAGAGAESSAGKEEEPRT
jgi:hypothetical protein